MLAGATDADNDYLSTELAEPNDWWFHADSVPGNAGLAPVHCTQARNVKKPRGAKVGTVHVTKGSVLKVRPDISFAVRVSGAPKPAAE